MEDRRHFVPDIRLMTSCELTSGFNFSSRCHLCIAVLHLLTKCGQSGDIDNFPKFKMAAVRILVFVGAVGLPIYEVQFILDSSVKMSS